MMRWEDVKNRIVEEQQDSASWKSDKKYLLQAFEKAEKFEIDPKNAYHAPLSNLRAIVKELRFAMDTNDRERIEELFRLSAECSYSDLRIGLGSMARDKIFVEIIENTKGDFYRIYFTKNQFDRLVKATKRIFVFDVIGKAANKN